MKKELLIGIALIISGIVLLALEINNISSLIGVIIGAGIGMVIVSFKKKQKEKHSSQ